MINGTKAFITNSGTDISGGTTITAVTGTTRRRQARNLEPHRAARHARLRAQQEVQEDGLARVGHARALASPTPPFRRKTCSDRAAKGTSNFFTILDGGRISVAALSIGLAMGAYDEALASTPRSAMRSASPSASFRPFRSSSSTC